MTFVSLEWLLVMVVTVAVFWATPARFRLPFLALGSAAYLLAKDPLSLLWLAVLTALTYVLTRGPAPDGRRAALAIAPIALVLFGYKVASVSNGDDLLTDTIIPFGLSFYTLRCIHYVIERYKGTIRDLGPQDLVGYLFFIPTLFVGPIHRFPEWRRDARRHRWDGACFSEGLERILNGYVKVAFLGNYLVSQVYADWVADVTDPGTAQFLYLDMIRIGLNLYFQFSGFSDIAIGFARLLGFRVMENFRWPYLQRNINEFWNSWHISLTSWSRDYVYTSVIAMTRSPALGVLSSLTAIALWHEVSLRYLVWGAYHGIGIIVWQRSQRLWRVLPPVRNVWMRRGAHALSVFATVNFVFLGFLLVRQPDVSGMIDVIETFITGWS